MFGGGVQTNFMTASPYVESMNRLQRDVGAELKHVGFKVRARTYNRITDEGLTEVVSFQMGPSDPPGTTYIAGLRENLHGWFTVSLKVYVPVSQRKDVTASARMRALRYHPRRPGLAVRLQRVIH